MLRKHVKDFRFKEMTAPSVTVQEPQDWYKCDANHVLYGTTCNLDLLQYQGFWLEMGARKWEFLCNRLPMITRQCEAQHPYLIETNHFISLQLETEVSWLLLLTSDIQTALSTISSCCAQSFIGGGHHGTFTSRAQEKKWKGEAWLVYLWKAKNGNEMWWYLLRSCLTSHKLL